LLATALLRGDGTGLAGFATALAGFGFSAYLTYLELFTIEAICQWCVSSAVLMTLLLVLNTTRAFAYMGRQTGKAKIELEEDDERQARA